MGKMIEDMKVNEDIDYGSLYQPARDIYVIKKDGSKIRIHDLRHSHASLLIELGFAPLLISERLGHENIETTLNTYSHLYPNKHGEVAEILSKLIQN